LLRALQHGEVERVGAERPERVDVRVIAATNRDLAAEVAAGSFREDLFYRLDVIRIHTPALREHRQDIPELARHLLDQAGHEVGVATPAITDAAVARLTSCAFPGNVRQLANCLTRALVMADGRIDTDHLELADPAGTPARDHPDRFPTLAEMEATHIRAALERCTGNKSAAARLLGISRPTIHKKIVDYGIETS
jgi:DNA-binding NtrC family response regulator